jgi:predicted phage-related endonuclease
MSALQADDAQWHLNRIGKVTGTRSYIVCKTDKKGGVTAAYNKLVDTLAMQIITGEEEKIFTSPAMLHGTMKEPICRVRFSFTHGVDVREVGFQDHPTVPMSGASLDGIIDSEKASIEIKCPQRKNHELYLTDPSIPPEYLCQIQWGLACYPELTHSYFVSYNEEFDLQHQLLIRRVERNQKMISLMEEKIIEFNKLVEARVAEIRGA